MPLDIVLVPWCQRMFGNGAVGAVLSFVITEFVMVVAGLRLLPKGTLGIGTVCKSSRILYAGLVMLAVA